MTDLPSQHPHVSLHLTDSTLTPLITSSSSPTHLESLTSLTSAAMTSHSTVSHINLGIPQRIMVEYPNRGAVVLQSYIDPHKKNVPISSEDRPRSSHLPTIPSYRPQTTASDSDDTPPRLVGVVVAGSADRTREARRAAASLERVGRDLQREWAEPGPSPGPGPGAD